MSHYELLGTILGALAYGGCWVWGWWTGYRQGYEQAEQDGARENAEAARLRELGVVVSADTTTKED